MKKILITLAASLGLAHALHAQSLTLNPGFTEQTLFSTSSGFSIAAMGTDAAGNIYYLDTGNFGSGPTTKLLTRTAASGYSIETPLFDYGNPVFGDFVKVNGSTVYFGESSLGSIKSISTSGGSILTSVTVANNYDFSFRGSTAFVDSADANFVNNRVSAVNPATGALTPVLQTNGASGPFAFEPDGSLIYGASTFGDTGGIYFFSSAQVANALTSTPLTLSQGTLLFNNGANQYVAYLNSHALFQADSSGATNLLRLYDPTNLTSQVIGQIDTANDGDIFDGLGLVGNSVAVAVTSQFGSGPSTVFLVTPTPEPGSAVLLSIGGAWLLGRRNLRKRPKAGNLDLVTEPER